MRLSAISLTLPAREPFANLVLGQAKFVERLLEAAQGAALWTAWNLETLQRISTVCTPADTQFRASGAPPRSPTCESLAEDSPPDHGGNDHDDRDDGQSPKKHGKPNR